MDSAESTTILSPRASPDLLAALAALETLAAELCPADDVLQGEQLTRFRDRLAQVVEAAGTVGLVGIQDVGLLFDEALAAVSEDPQQSACVDLLKAWPRLARGYIEDPHSGLTGHGLIDLLCDARWPTPLGQDEAHVLETLLQPGGGNSSLLSNAQATQVLDKSAHDFATSGVMILSQHDEARDQPPSVLLPADLVDALAAMEASADELPSEGEVSQGDPLTRFRDQLGGVVEAAGVAGLVGIQDVGLLFDEALAAVSEDSDNSACVDVLRAWPRLVRGHLENPNDGLARNELINLLCDPRWPQPLGQDEARMLETLLQPGCAHQDTLDTAQATQALEVAQAPDSGSDLSNVTTRVLRGTERDTGDESSVPRLESAPPLRADSDASLQDTTAQNVDPELVALLQSEFSQITNAIAAHLTPASSEQATSGTACERLCQEVERLECFGNAAEAAGLTGFGQAARRVERNLRWLVERGGTISPVEAELLLGWERHGTRYLAALEDPESRRALIAHLCDQRWPEALPSGECDELDSLLQLPVLATPKQGPARRAERADQQDVALRLPEDVDPELLEALLQELPSQTAELSAAVQRLLAGGAVADVDAAQRIAHTVKGAANTVGVRGIATLTHNLEDILLAFSRQGAVPPRALGETLVNAADCLESMSEALTGLAAPPAQAVEVLQQVLDWANHIDQEGIPASEPEQPASRVSITPQSHTPTSAEAAATTTPVLRVPAATIDELLRLVGETIILTGQIHERLQRTIAETRAMREQFRLAHSLSSELEQLIDVRDLTKAGRTASGDLDPLEFDQFNELHSCSRRLIEATEDSRESAGLIEEHLGALDAMLVDQRRVNVESQEAVLQTRMVPVKNVFPRLERSVRQTCRATGRQAQLHVTGGETLIDSDVLNDLVDPLMHLLRNAVDHGIEDEAGRWRHGKPLTGRIDLEFCRDGNQIVVRCTDDGCGLDAAGIRQAAEERGIVSADQVLSDEDLFSLILRPNFSTRRHATHVSGRGIGLDAVYSRVLELKGSLELHSEALGGLTVELRLPITLISTHALLVRAGGDIVALSNRGVEQVLHSRSGEVRSTAGETTYCIGDEVYPARHLTTLLGTVHCPERGEIGAAAVLLVRAENGVTGVIVSEVVDNREIVVKGMGRYMPQIPGITGATILGDGTVKPVIDLPELLCQRPTSLPQVATEDADVNVVEGELRRSALIVDDSLSARRSLAQFVQDSGYEVSTARDGLEAVELIDTHPPDLLLVDLEMPRMNGLELTHHVRARAETRDVPIIMVTSRSTQKHREMARAAGVDAYLTKPFSEEELFGCMEAASTRSAQPGMAARDTRDLSRRPRG